MNIQSPNPKIKIKHKDDKLHIQLPANTSDKMAVALLTFCYFYLLFYTVRILPLMITTILPELIQEAQRSDWLYMVFAIVSPIVLILFFIFSPIYYLPKFKKAIVPEQLEADAQKIVITHQLGGMILNQEEILVKELKSITSEPHTNSKNDKYKDHHYVAFETNQETQLTFGNSGMIAHLTKASDADFMARLLNEKYAIEASESAKEVKGTIQEKQIKQGNIFVTLHTSKGDIKLKMFNKRAPKTVFNFVALSEGTKAWSAGRKKKVKKPLYPGTIFHRVIPDFMIQGGDPLGTGVGNPGYRFADEFHPELRHSKEGILSMANSGPNSNGCQFFITLKATHFLDDKHSVFGEVIEGMDVVHAIALVDRNANDKPFEDIQIKDVTVLQEES